MSSKQQSTLSHEAAAPSVPNRAGAAVLFLILLMLIWYSGRAGLASLLSSYALKANQIAAANAAVGFNSRDPETHLARGAILEAAHDLPGAISEYQLATTLRPADYVLWLTLARVQELDGDVGGALSSARQAVPLAPSYAQPRWQLGNILIRAGQRQEGFKELRLAAISDPKLAAVIIELAWQLYGGDAQLVKQAMQPQSATAYLALAENFRRHGRVEDAVSMFGGTGVESRLIRNQYLEELISEKRFHEAYSLQAQDRAPNSNLGQDVIQDAGFEQEIELEQPGFGWRAGRRSSSLLLSLDAANPLEGHSSLQIEFKGDSDPAGSIISQLVLLESQTRYQLHFAARAEAVISGGLPSVTVTDASDSATLGHVVLLQRAGGWQHYIINFDSKEATTAVKISLHREPCSNSPCPIFGKLWLDDFSLKAVREQ